MTSEGISKWFRLLWLGITLLAWVFVLYLGSQHSERPDVLGRYSWKYAGMLGAVICVAIAISFSNRSATLARLYTYRFAATALLLSLVLGLSFVELATRLLDPLGISYYEETGRYHLDKIADEKLIYRHPPSWQSRYQGVEVQTNEMGLRDEPIKPKGEEEFRVLALGDSVTFGWGVRQDQVFASRLEKLLSQKLGRPVTVINTGVGSYNTVQEYTFLKDVGLDLQPDLIVLLYVNNDIEVHRRPFDPWSERSLIGKSPPEAMMILLGKSWFYRLAIHASEHGWFASRKQPGIAPELSHSNGWTASMNALRDIVRLVYDKKVPTAVFYFRWAPNAADMALMGDVQQAVAPLPVGDVGQWFGGQDLIKYMNSKVDTHPNAEGHRVIAAEMATYLDVHGLLPADGRPQP